MCDAAVRRDTLHDAQETGGADGEADLDVRLAAEGAATLRRATCNVERMSGAAEGGKRVCFAQHSERIIWSTGGEDLAMAAEGCDETVAAEQLDWLAGAQANEAVTRLRLVKSGGIGPDEKGLRFGKVAIYVDGAACR